MPKTPVDIARALSRDVDALTFSAPVATVYNPLAYAWEAHRRYLERYASGKKEILFVGMNPGPFGMVQTGVPFGEVEAARSWLGIDGGVRRPRDEHPKRPIEGFACKRSEVSGRRLWGFMQKHFSTPERMAKRLLVANYCPLAFLEEGGRNRTPDKLPASEREPLFAACDAALHRLVEVTGARIVIGIGRFAALRIAAAVADLDVVQGQILHPSPASPLANRGWDEQVDRQLDALGVRLG